MIAASNPGKLQVWLSRAALTAVIWSAIGVVFALPSLAGASNWRNPLLVSLAEWWSWGLLSWAIVAADQRLPFSSRQPIRRIVAHLFLSPLFTAVYLYLVAAVLAAMRFAPWSRLLSGQLLLNAIRGMFLWSVLVYWLIVGVWQAYLYHQRYLSGELRMERLERSFSQARLNALRMQLDPHFLFNALNTISAQVEREPRLARQMIEHLGDLLRLSLENKDRQEVPLIEEMAFLEHYLAIQRIRFGDRLRFATEIAPEVKYAMVPCLVLQPLVENAIRHGLSSRATGGAVAVSARRVEKQLEICVTDDGVGLPLSWTLETGAGLGLSVTRERVRGLHPNGGTRFAVRRLSQGTEAVIRVPLRFDSDPHEVDEPAEAGHDPAAD
jgi:two-component system, LytTR family, sensor kinase